MRRVGWLSVVAVSLLVLVAGCDSGRGIQKQPHAPSPATGSSTIVISSMKFSQDATVAPGGKVTVRNEDTIPHSVTSDDGLFDTREMAAHSTATFTAPAKPGRYGYHCSIHPNMTAHLTVKGSGGSS
jgi:plastocyanin